MNRAGLAVLISRSILELLQSPIERYNLKEYNPIFAGLIGVVVALVLGVGVDVSEYTTIDSAFGAFVVGVGAPILHELLKLIQYATEYLKRD